MLRTYPVQPYALGSYSLVLTAAAGEDDGLLCCATGGTMIDGSMMELQERNFAHPGTYYLEK